MFVYQWNSRSSVMHDSCSLEHQRPDIFFVVKIFRLDSKKRIVTQIRTNLKCGDLWDSWSSTFVVLSGSEPFWTKFWYLLVHVSQEMNKIKDVAHDIRKVVIFHKTLDELHTHWFAFISVPLNHCFNYTIWNRSHFVQTTRKYFCHAHHSSHVGVKFSNVLQPQCFWFSWTNHKRNLHRSLDFTPRKNNIISNIESLFRHIMPEPIVTT